MASRPIGGDFVGREMTVNRSTENCFLARSHLDARPRDNPEGLLANWVINDVEFSLSLSCTVT